MNTRSTPPQELLDQGANGCASARPVFDLMGRNKMLVGGNGDGQTTKVADQIIVALTIEAVGQGLADAAE